MPKHNITLEFDLSYTQKEFFCIPLYTNCKTIQPVELYFAVQEPGPVGEGIHATLERLTLLVINVVCLDAFTAFKFKLTQSVSRIWRLFVGTKLPQTITLVQK